MYSIGLAYLLWFLSGFGALGFHRFYLGKIPTGVLWMFTGGLVGIGSIYDFFTLPGQVREANVHRAILSQPGYNRNIQYAENAGSRIVHQKDTVERTILKIAKENKGILTVSEVALAANISVDQAKKDLDALVSKGIADLRVRKSGTLVYVLPEIMDSGEPLEDF